MDDLFGLLEKLRNKELPFGGISGRRLLFKALKVPPTVGFAQAFSADALELRRP